MNGANEHVFSHGMQDTRDTLAAWNGHPWPVLRSWLALSLAIALSVMAEILMVQRGATGIPISEKVKRGIK